MIQPLASLIAAGEIAPGARIRADLIQRKDKLIIREIADDPLAPAC